MPNVLRKLYNILTDWQLLRSVLWRRLYLEGYLPFVISRRQARYVKKLKHKDFVNVVFLPMSVAMWKYQHIYELLKKDHRFRVYLFLSPFANFTKSQRLEQLQAMRAFFDKKEMKYVDYELEEGKPMIDIRSVVDPDIIFYTQPYKGVMEEVRRHSHFYDKLLCYVPYAFLPRRQEMLYKRTFNTYAWKLYYPTKLIKDYAKRVNRNKACNVVVAGYPGADDYFTPMKIDPWKVMDRSKKRIIWAPHFTIRVNVGFFHVSYFLEMANYMQELAMDYADRITFAFKPHPALYTLLCNHPDWGEEKAKEYYDFWASHQNTQLETAEFVDLFKGSDAMIHDCGSFVIDYLYFGKPTLYDNPNIDDAKASADELGTHAYDAHYRVTSLSDIKKFIDDVVLVGNDPLESVRKEFFDTYLRRTDNRTASQFIYDDIVNSIWGNPKDGDK